MIRKFLLIILFLSFTFSLKPAYSKDIILAELNGTVGVQMEEFVREVVEAVDESQVGLIIFEMDTPGGLVEAMRGIVQSILASRVPVAVWVSPGGRAASAGAFIVQAAHVAAMSPGTNIGAAHPVVASGEDIKESDMSKKIMNDLKAQMRSVVQLRGRNQEITQQMIEESISLTANEALKSGVIDIIAGDVNALIRALSGRIVKTGSRTEMIDINSRSRILRAEMSFRDKLIQFVSNPEIAYLLLSGGMMAIFFEVITPGGFMLGTAGGVMLLLGAIGLKMLPFNWAGILLILAGALLVAIDIFAGTSGILSLLGVPVFCLGGVFLFRAPGGELLRISMSVIIGITIALVLCLGLVAFLVIKGLRRKVSTGSQGMTGLEVRVISEISQNLEGQVMCHGELWRAISESGIMQAGETGIVSAIDGMLLKIKK